MFRKGGFGAPEAAWTLWRRDRRQVTLSNLLLIRVSISVAN